MGGVGGLGDVVGCVVIVLLELLVEYIEECFLLGGIVNLICNVVDFGGLLWLILEVFEE